MKEYLRLGMKETGDEVIENRGIDSKTFHLGENVMNMQSAQQPIHYYKNNKLHDIDLAPEDFATYWEISNTPYQLRVWKASPKIQLFLPGGVQLSMEIRKPSDCRSEPCPHGQKFAFKGLFDGELRIIATASEVVTELFVKSGITDNIWYLSQNTPDIIISETNARGTDFEGNAVDLIIDRSPLIKNLNLWTGTFRERFTGNKLKKDSSTRVLSKGGAAVYPVTIIT